MNRLTPLALLTAGLLSACGTGSGSVSLGIPRAGIVPTDLSVTAPMFNVGDATLWGRGDVTFGLGTRLMPALGATVIVQPAERYGAYRPFIGAGATTITAQSGTQIRPAVVAGVQTRFDTWGLEKLGTRLETAMVFTDRGPRFNAALGLTYRLNLGGTR